jgi:hypothetical protein
MRETERLPGAMSAINGAGDSVRNIGGCQTEQCGSASTDGCSTMAQQVRGPSIRTTVEVRADNRFEQALGAAKDGLRIARAGWNGGGQWVEVQYPDKNSRMTQPYCVLHTTYGHLVPWVPSQGDLFARDWAILPRA